MQIEFYKLKYKVFVLRTMYCVLCNNTIQTAFVSLPVQKGDRVAQLILERIFLPDLLELDVSGIA